MLSQYRNSHHKDKTVLRPSYLYNENTYTRKGGLYNETGPCKHVPVSTPLACRAVFSVVSLTFWAVRSTVSAAWILVLATCMEAWMSISWISRKLVKLVLSLAISTPTVDSAFLACPSWKKVICCYQTVRVGSRIKSIMAIQCQK